MDISKYAEILKLVLTLLIGLGTIITAIVITLNAAKGVGMMRLLEKRGKDSVKWLGFVPVLSGFGLGAIADSLTKKKGKAFSLILGISSLAATLLWIAASVIGNFAVVDALKNALELLMSEQKPTLEILKTLSAYGYLSLLTLAILFINRIVSFVALHKTYKAFTPKTAVLKTIFTILIYPLSSIFLFTLRNKECEYE